MANNKKVKAQSDQEIAAKYLSKVRSSADRGIDFTIKFAEFAKIAREAHCYFTDVPLNLVQSDANQHTLDRIDNDKGYVKGNVVACSFAFNQIKGQLTVAQINQLYKGLHKSDII
tara:strand:+ start:107 stop:451 length:345 start_codon:yes stop_codon:yes gene_type:complete